MSVTVRSDRKAGGVIMDPIARAHRVHEELEASRPEHIRQREAQPSYPEFHCPELVVIEGCPDPNMNVQEPFIFGSTLFFNSLFLPGRIKKTFQAKRKLHNPHLFGACEPIGGQILSPAEVDAAPSLTQPPHPSRPRIYFISTRAAMRTDPPKTVWTGEYYGRNPVFGEPPYVRWAGPVEGDIYDFPAPDERDWLVFDAEISRDGEQLYFALGRFNDAEPDNNPTSSKIIVAERNGTPADFKKLDKTDELLEEVNDPFKLTYAPSLSTDKLELYFTGVTEESGVEIIRNWVSVRSGPGEKWLPPRPLPTPGICMEGPSISEDGNHLYFHKYDAGIGRFRIFVMTRVGAPLDNRCVVP